MTRCLFTLSHGHPDHNGNDNYFQNAKHYFNGFDYSNSQYQLDALFQNVSTLTVIKYKLDKSTKVTCVCTIKV
jgi:hypothetical protein